MQCVVLFNHLELFLVRQVEQQRCDPDDLIVVSGRLGGCGAVRERGWDRGWDRGTANSACRAAIFVGPACRAGLRSLLRPPRSQNRHVAEMRGRDLRRRFPAGGALFGRRSRQVVKSFPAESERNKCILDEGGLLPRLRH